MFLYGCCCLATATHKDWLDVLMVPGHSQQWTGTYFDRTGQCSSFTDASEVGFTGALVWLPPGAAAEPLPLAARCFSWSFGAALLPRAVPTLLPCTGGAWSLASPRPCVNAWNHKRMDHRFLGDMTDRDRWHDCFCNSSLGDRRQGCTK